mgnify:CR=1 FL=1
MLVLNFTNIEQIRIYLFKAAIELEPDNGAAHLNSSYLKKYTINPNTTIEANIIIAFNAFN